jgi:hypothetical protein
MAVGWFSFKEGILLVPLCIRKRFPSILLHKCSAERTADVTLAVTSFLFTWPSQSRVNAQSIHSSCSTPKIYFPIS